MKALEVLASLLAPPRCPVCDEVLLPGTQCAACAPALDRLAYADCRPPCTVPGLSGLRSGWRYDGGIQEGILRMKFASRPDQAENFILLLLSRPGMCTFVREFDIIIPVPSTKSERRARGYDLPQLLGRALSRRTGVPAASHLQKVRDTRRQVELGGAERRRNLNGAFAAAGPVRGCRVLLVDDVTTTGSTLRECAAALRRAGAADVWGITIAATN